MTIKALVPGEGPSGYPSRTVIVAIVARIVPVAIDRTVAIVVRNGAGVVTVVVIIVVVVVAVQTVGDGDTHPPAIVVIYIARPQTPKRAVDMTFVIIRRGKITI